MRDDELVKLVRLLSPTTAAEPLGRGRELLRGLAALVRADGWLMVSSEDADAIVTELASASPEEGAESNPLNALGAERLTQLARQLREPLRRNTSFTASLQELLGPRGLDHPVVSAASLLAVCPTLDGRAFVACLLFRWAGAPAFDSAQRALVHAVVSETRWQACTTSLPGRLSPRLRQVLSLLLEGKTKKEVAAELDLSAHTVHDYTRELYRTLGVHSRAELAFKCAPAARVPQDQGGLPD